MSAMIAWYSIPVDTVDHPTTVQATAWQTAAEVDFEALTDLAYDDTISKHVRLYRMLCANYLYFFYKTGNRMAASLGVSGASAAYQASVPYYSKDDIEKAIEKITTAMTWTHL